jgi:hypothetical protein
MRLLKKSQQEQNGIPGEQPFSGEKIKKLEPGFPVLREAVAAIDRAAFCWFKRHFAFFPTV